jgi:endonuclease YncB( thermonuclease family)
MKQQKQHFDGFRRDLYQILDVHDGDTVTALVENGFDSLRRITFRLKDINTAEMKSKTEERKILAEKAKEFVISTLEGKQVGVESYKFKDGGFSRYLGVIYYLEDGEWINLNEQLLQLGLAQGYYKGASKDQGTWIN